MRFARFAGFMPGKLLVVVGIGVGVLAASTPASADTFSATYFSVTESNAAGSDFHPAGVGTGTGSNNYVTNTLSGGMPVFNAGSYTAAAGYTLPAAAGDVNGSNVLEWWTPGSSNGGVNVVTETGMGVFTTTGSAQNMFPPDSTGNNDSTMEETAILSGDFDLGSAQTVTFTAAADDDVFIFVDGTYVGGLGGIHAAGSPVDYTTGMLGAGYHNVEIFYADQDQVAASLDLSSNVPVSATPEPGSLALLGTGILAIGGTLRRRMMR